MSRKPAATAPITPDDLAEARRLLAEMNPELRQIGADWYPLVHDRCRAWAAETGYTLEQVAAVVALYSINQSWAGNLTLARRALVEGKMLGLERVVVNVRAVLSGAPIEQHLTAGSKVKNFYRSILLQDSCTVDRWMFKVFGKPQGETWYPWVERCIRIMALEAGIPAWQMQAVLWIAAVAEERGTVQHHCARAA